MNAIKPLSPLLQELVNSRALPEYVARVFNRLPNVAHQKEAVDCWKERLDGPAKEIVAEYEQMGPTNRGPGGVEVYLDYDHVAVAFGYYHYQETLEDYLAGLRSAMNRLLDSTPCFFCEKPLKGDRRHVNCKALNRYSSWCENYRQRIKQGIDVAENEKWLQACEPVVRKFRQAYQTGFFPDGSPWAVSCKDDPDPERTRTLLPTTKSNGQAG